jgi:hypothetical protein
MLSCLPGIQSSPNLWAVEESSARECGAIITSIGKVNLWSTTNTIDHGHKGELKNLFVL